MLIKDINDALDRYDAACAEEDRKLREVRDAFTAERVTRKTLVDAEAGHKKAVADLASECRQGVLAAFERYTSGLPARYAMTPQAMDNSDVVLLQSSLKLDGRDLEMMAERHKDNMPMRRAIADYAAEHGVETGVVFYSQKQREEAAADFVGAVVSALQSRDGLQYAFIRDGRAVPQCLVGE